MKNRYLKFELLTLILIFACSNYAQSGHSARNTANIDGSILNVTASKPGDTGSKIKTEDLYLYENAVEQRIKSFSFDPSPARIVLLIDNSQTVPASVDQLGAAAMEFAYEIFEGDQLYVIAYDEKPEIIQEWTDDAETLKKSLLTLRKQGNPHLFDAINAASAEILVPLMPSTRKTVIVVIGDGLDRGSKTPFDGMLDELQNRNITVYALQIRDRSNGAYRRNSPKAGKVIDRITKETGGLAFPIDQAQTAAKTICDELRRNRYLLSYFSSNSSSYDSRSLFLVGSEGEVFRTKSAQPPNIKQ